MHTSRAGMRIRHTRFILPGHKTESYSTSLPWETERLLADFDRVFSMLDGKMEPDVSLAQASRFRFEELRKGKRISTSYFDLRYFRGIGTLHFFPKSQEIMDRLNRIVGARRKWLPPEGEKVGEAFWLQYNQAEALEEEIRKEIATKSGAFSGWNDPNWKLFHGSPDEVEKAHASILDAVGLVHDRHGIPVDHQIAQPEQKQLLLIAA